MSYEEVSGLAYEHIGKHIREARVRQNLSAQELADRIGVARPTLYGWERGDFLPETKYLPSIRQALSTSLDVLFGVDDEDLVLSDAEKELIRAYRALPEMQLGVKRILCLPE